MTITTSKRRRGAARNAAAVAALTAVALAPGSARAEPPAPPPGETRSYAWETLASDAAALGLVFSGQGLRNETESDMVAFAGAVVWTLVPPLLHLGHRRGGAAAVSLGMRVLLPLGGAFVASWIEGARCRQGEDEGCSRGAAWAFGAGTGVVTASAVDAIFLARERVVPPSGPTFTLAPTKGGAQLVFAGRF